MNPIPDPDPAPKTPAAEPVGYAAGAQVAIAAFLGVLAAFGVHITPTQISAVLAFTAAVLGLVVRAKVTPTG